MRSCSLFSQGAQHSSLCHSLEAWDGVAGERGGLKGGDVSMFMADSHHCMAEANTIL